MFHSKFFWFIIIILILVLIVLSTVFVGPINQWIAKTISRQEDWYAIYLNNGQIYFGQIKSLDAATIQLAKVYSLQSLNVPGQSASGENLQLQSQPQTIYNVVKRGSDKVLSTDGTLFVNRSFVLFWEKLESNSEVVRGIKKSIGK